MPRTIEEIAQHAADLCCVLREKSEDVCFEAATMIEVLTSRLEAEHDMHMTVVTGEVENYKEIAKLTEENAALLKERDAYKMAYMDAVALPTSVRLRDLEEENVTLKHGVVMRK